MKRIIYTIAVILFILFTATGVGYTIKSQQRLNLKKIELQDTNAKLKLLENRYSDLNGALQDKSKSLEQIQKEQQDLLKQKEELERQLQARAIQRASEAVLQQQIAYAASFSGQDAKMYIYTHESNNNVSARNSIGCVGIGQACPGTQVYIDVSKCGNNYACQDVAFTNYMLNRYGSWNKAMLFWLKSHWW